MGRFCTRVSAPFHPRPESSEFLGPRLQEGGFNAPRRGRNDDNAHPPIHPTAHAGNLAGDEKKVYDFIVRRFLANCSKDAEGSETTVEVDYGREKFYASGQSVHVPTRNGGDTYFFPWPLGLVVLQRNYLDVYPYDKWTGKELPNFREGEVFEPTCELKQGQTTSPSYLTEADLVAMMDKNGIGMYTLLFEATV